MAGNRINKKAFLIVCAITLVLSLTGCKKKTPSPDSENEIASDTGEDLVVENSEAPVIELGVGVGPVRFGMSKEEVIKHLGQPDKIDELMQKLKYKY